jgi:hypothetical protein
MLMSLIAASITAVTPPTNAGPWSRRDAPRIIEPAGIFQYMNGAGELYLAYRFRRIEVHEYTAEGKPPILLELYRMETSDDAYGLLSVDWGGEPVDLGSGRALYGSGLLRIWSNDLYARVLVESESEAARQAILSIGSSVVSGRRNPPPPSLIPVLPQIVAGEWRLRQDRTTFLRSHLVLNSVYFLSTENVLGLDHEAEAVVAQYAGPPAPGSHAYAHLLVIGYPSEKRASRALKRFRTRYLEQPPSKDEPVRRDVRRIEDGWMGHRLEGRVLALVFQAESRETAETFLDAAQARAIR